MAKQQREKAPRKRSEDGEPQSKQTDDKNVKVARLAEAEQSVKTTTAKNEPTKVVEDKGGNRSKASAVGSAKDTVSNSKTSKASKAEEQRKKALQLLKDEESGSEEEKDQEERKDASSSKTKSVQTGDKRANKHQHNRSFPTIPAGTVVVGRVDLENERIKLPVGSLLVQFRGGVGKRFGRVDITEVREKEKWVDNPFEALKHGQFVKCVVLKANPSANPSTIVELSMKQSLIDAASVAKSDMEKDELFGKELAESNQVPAHDSLVTGYVVGASEKGCFIRVSRHLTGRVLLKNLSQGFVKDVQGEFPVGKLVAGRVLNADETTGKFELTLRSSAVVGDSEQKWAWNTLSSGTIVDGVIHKLIPAGILVSLPSSGGLTGLCHLSQVFDDDDPINHAGKRKQQGKKRHHRSESGSSAPLDEEQKQRLRQEIARAYRVGDMVKCLVLEVDADAKKMQLGMKPSYFQSLLDAPEQHMQEEEEEVMDIEEEEEEAKEEDEHSEGEEEDAEEKVEEDDDEEVEDESGSEEEDVEDNHDDEEEDEEDDDQKGGDDDGEDDDDDAPVTLQDAMNRIGVNLKSATADSSSLSKKLQATKQHLAKGSDGDVDDGDDAKGSRVNNKRRDAQKRKAEATTSELEERIVSNAAPETVEEFERVLVSKRNSSLTWIQYISLLVSIGDMDKARATGERALKTISPELEDERNNVWSALLSMELQFGSVDQAKALFAKMVRFCDEKWAYLTLCDAYWSLPASHPDRLKLAEEAIRGAKKASKQQSAKVWLRHFRLKFDAGDMVEGRKLLKEALRFVPKHKQVKVMLGFARLEFSHENGDKERGRTIMEGILDNYPKRTDVWHVFIDLEIKYGTADRVRSLFERALGLRMSTKKVKSLFKKWLQFESGPKGGGEAYMESVKERARKFVESLVGGGDDDEGDEASDD